MKYSDYKELKVWQESILLVEETYKLVSLLPQHEKFGLSDQIIRAVVSVPSNIAEGQARESSKDFCRFLAIARDSLAELETQFIICHRLQYITVSQLNAITTYIQSIGRMISSLRRYLESPQP